MFMRTRIQAEGRQVKQNGSSSNFYGSLPSWPYGSMHAPATGTQSAISIDPTFKGLQE